MVKLPPGTIRAKFMRLRAFTKPNREVSTLDHFGSVFIEAKNLELVAFA